MPGITLDRGEKELWSGVPAQGLLLRQNDMFMIPFSLVWCGFAVFWEAGVISHPTPPFFKVIGGLFVCVGLYIVFGRFFADAWRRSGTTYAVTSDRVVINTGGLMPSQKSLNLRTLSDVTMQERGDGSGTITFGPTYYRNAMWSGGGWPGVPQTPCFDRIPDVAHVYSIIRDAQRAGPPVAQ